jgi:glutathionyl-hydroquinone reductase
MCYSKAADPPGKQAQTQSKRKGAPHGLAGRWCLARHLVRHEEIRRQIRPLKASQFRNWITADGSAGPSGKGGFKAEAGRYHLYVSLACPWAHRTLIFRKLKGLEDMISVDVVSPLMYDKGWVFDAEPARCNRPTGCSATRPPTSM